MGEYNYQNSMVLFFFAIFMPHLALSVTGVFEWHNAIVELPNGVFRCEAKYRLGDWLLANPVNNRVISIVAYKAKTGNDDVDSLPWLPAGFEDEGIRGRKAEIENGEAPPAEGNGESTGKKKVAEDRAPADGAGLNEARIEHTGASSSDNLARESLKRIRDAEQTDSASTKKSKNGCIVC